MRRLLNAVLARPALAALAIAVLTSSIPSLVEAQSSGCVAATYGCPTAAPHVPGAGRALLGAVMFLLFILSGSRGLVSWN